MITNQKITSNAHWNYFLALDEDVVNLSRYLELNEQNFACYSLELARILFAASSEIDVIAKRICLEITPNLKCDNIDKYRKQIIPKYPQIGQTIIEIPRYGLMLNPWKAWADDANPDWWRAYNDVKHERHIYFNHANLRNALNAVAGLFVLLLYFYPNEANDGLLSPDPKLLRAGHPFTLDQPHFGPAVTLYQFSKIESIDIN